MSQNEPHEVTMERVGDRVEVYPSVGAGNPVHRILSHNAEIGFCVIMHGDPVPVRHLYFDRFIIDKPRAPMFVHKPETSEAVMEVLYELREKINLSNGAADHAAEISRRVGMTDFSKRHWEIVMQKFQEKEGLYHGMLTALCKKAGIDPEEYLRKGVDK